MTDLAQINARQRAIAKPPLSVPEIPARSRPGVSSPLYVGRCVGNRVEVHDGEAIEVAYVQRLLTKPTTTPSQWATEFVCVAMFPPGQLYQPNSMIEYRAMQFSDGAQYVGRAILCAWDWTTSPAQYWEPPDCDDGEDCGPEVPPDDVPEWDDICGQLFPEP